MVTLLLFDRFAGLKARVAHERLGTFPTRVERLRGLVPDDVELWCKRDDESGGPYGGNKVRKLEFILADAKARGFANVATVGGIGSHHVLATGVYGAKLGLGVRAVVFPQPINDHVEQTRRLDRAVGVELRETGGMFGVPLACLKERRRASTLWVTGGGSSVLGTLGYVEAGLELRAQVERGELPMPDLVYVAMGSCGTVAGLLVGLAGDNAPTVVAVRVVDRPLSNGRKARGLARRVQKFLGDERPLAPLKVEHGQFGKRYGEGTAASHAAVERAKTAGLILEETYTGKAFAALLADADSGALANKRVLFVHTYSSADLSALLK